MRWMCFSGARNKNMARLPHSKRWTRVQRQTGTMEDRQCSGPCRRGEYKHTAAKAGRRGSRQSSADGSHVQMQRHVQTRG